MNQITTETINTQAVSFKTFKEAYKQYTHAIHQAKKDKKQAQRDFNAQLVWYKDKELSLSCMMYVYYMLMAKSSNKLHKAFANNLPLLKTHLENVLRTCNGMTKRNQTFCQWMGLKETDCAYHLMNLLDQAEIKGHIVEKVNQQLIMIKE